MRKTSRFWFVMLSVFLASCTNSTPTREQACQNSGGEFRIDEAADFDEGSCYRPTADAGKTCTDSFQCLSFCVGKDKSALQGQCYQEMPFSGCAEVFNGGFLMEVCQ